MYLQLIKYENQNWNANHHLKKKNIAINSETIYIYSKLYLFRKKLNNYILSFFIQVGISVNLTKIIDILYPRKV